MELSGQPTVGKPEALFKTRLRALYDRPQYDVSLDGRRLLLNRFVTRPNDEPLVLIQNWAAGLGE